MGDVETALLVSWAIILAEALGISYLWRTRADLRDEVTQADAIAKAGVDLAMVRTSILELRADLATLFPERPLLKLDK